MQALLAGCQAALLAYDPVLDRQRSSGLLWSYGAVRCMGRRPPDVMALPYDRDWATPYGRRLLGEGFAGFVAQRLLANSGGKLGTIG
ncbi:hypothetical protein [Cyanobium sp. Lug-B]|uniref:hypothetical protein n=1 Tax=Cyanobium sp. Lug-B TaxID=2823716 RepID=UPI0020CF5029|nr:hypothetical protein [Cyanobium sp. Lug-B]MCP9797728.1 hypothetical protein [Cyanobium sp. Lug-B]